VHRVRFIGRIPFNDVPQYYRLCDAFVYPRIDIPLTRLVPALKPLEAMAAGKPAIVSDLPALAELVGDRGNALLTPPGDIDALALHMKRLASDEAMRSRLGAAGQQYARSRTWETSTSSMRHILTTPIHSLDGA
jgi:glycosyltransferase involved in cell wall biosynthesis